MSNRAIFVSFIFSFLVISCSNDSFSTVEEETTAQFSDVDQRLWSYFEDFESEAQFRGLNYNLNALGVTGSIEPIPEQGVAGLCQYGSHIHDVTIDKDFWNSASQGLREFVVFHELGHCVLSRGHTETKFNNGTCKSIMRSGLGDCRDAYNSENREYYINELFANR